MGKLICEKVINGETMLLNATTAAGVVPTLLKTTPGVGKPFWYWPSIPAGTIAAVDFTNAPIVSSDKAANQAAMDSITVEPTDVLTYA
jgi:hypothetical protein